MPSNWSSSIRASIEFTQSTVFAGEDVECVITFRNVARRPGAERSPARSGVQSGQGLGERQRKIAPLAASTRPKLSRNPPTFPEHFKKGHRPAFSLSNSPLANNGVFSGEQEQSDNTPREGRPRHGRSLSIVSMGTDRSTPAEAGRGHITTAMKAARGHGRSASLQIAHPRRGSSPFIGPASGRSSVQDSPLLGPKSPSLEPIPDRQELPFRPGQRPPSDGHPRRVPSTRRSSAMLQQSFRFPPEPASTPEASRDPTPKSEPEARLDSQPLSIRSHSPRPPEDPPPLLESSLNRAPRVISASSMNGTPRSSMEFYSMSNNSSETLASEYAPQTSSRLLPRATHARQPSRANSVSPPEGPEVLMMGYAQVMGSFTLDGSLVNQAPFEEVKRKGVVGGAGGGGVVGVEHRSKEREAGLFGALGWSNIGESLSFGNLLGGGELSSIKGMRGIASSKSIPLLSTPQSILFVNLQLAPGEKSSYKYTFTLPRGLPPTHKGRAMKVAYHLTIGVQRPGTNNNSNEQHMRSVDVPFRVFGGVNARGEVLGHDLMAPYILLHDVARTISVSDSSPVKQPEPTSNLNDFLNYVGALLNKSNATASSPGVLLSPTAPGPRSFTTRRHSSVGETFEPQTMKEAIDFAILRANHLTTHSPHGTLSNKFDIARSGLRVATLLLPRPAYRLGETLHLLVDLRNAAIPTYALQIALESVERVDAAIAMRSPASILRYTRKVHAYAAENVLFARRAAFELAVPANATPEFVTSGVALEWRVRVEFVTARVSGKVGVGDSGDEDGDGDEEGEGEEGGGEKVALTKGKERLEHFGEDLLEEVQRDDRGIVLQGVENLRVEAFEVSVPIRVYGAVVGGRAEGEGEELVI